VPRISCIAALAVLALAGIAMPEARAQDTARGRQLFQLCAQCHGDAGQGDVRYQAPAIGGLEPWYIERQLVKFKQGARAYHQDDASGLQMRPMVRALRNDADLKAVVAYAASLAPPPPATTMRGDPERGKAAYATCVACHGDRGQGNQALNAPKLAGQADWYVASQLRKFKAGLRGTHPNDPTGALMRPMAMPVPDEAIPDLVAYIRTLPASR
jgi:cytochrome c553